MPLLEKLVPTDSYRFSGYFPDMPFWKIVGSGATIASEEDLSVSPNMDEVGGGPPRNWFLFTSLGGQEFVSPLYLRKDVFPNIGFHGSEPRIQSWKGLQPIQDDGNISARARYSEAFFQNVYRFFTGDWNFVSDSIPHIAGENPVTHTNLSGSVETGLALDNYHRDMTITLDSYLDKPGYTYPKTYVNLSRDSESLQVDINSHTDLDYHRDPFNFLHARMLDDRFSTGVHTYPDGTEGDMDSEHLETTWVSIQYRDEHRIEIAKISFLSTCVYKVDTYWRRVRHYITFSPSWTLKSPQTLMLDEDIAVSDLISLSGVVTYTFVDAHFIAPSNPGVWKSSGITFPNGSYQVEGIPLVVQDGFPPSGEGVSRLLSKDAITLTPKSSYRLLYDFRNNVDAIASELYPSVFYSSKDAIDTHLSRLETNNLENLTSLEFISMLIEPTQGFIALLKEVKQKDIVGTLKAALDLLTSAKLIYEYGICTTRQDAEEIVKRAGPVYDRVSSGDLFGQQTLRGKFTWDIPDGTVSGFNDLKLIARSKIRGHLRPESYFAALLPVRAFGLLPTLSSLWDLVPWSFVVDWFANIGGRLSDIDSSVEMLAFDISYSVHTIKVVSTLTTEHYDGCNFSAIVDDVQLTHFVRSVMQRVPTLTYSKLDFQAAGGVPDWFTAFSLVYKLF